MEQTKVDSMCGCACDIGSEELSTQCTVQHQAPLVCFADVLTLPASHCMNLDMACIRSIHVRMSLHTSEPILGA